MKHTSLFCAVALAAAMGTSAFATSTTTQVNKATFEEEQYTVGAMTRFNGSYGWTVQTEDTSSIIAAPLSESTAQDGYAANKHLNLNTEGTELKWEPGTIDEPKSLIEMKVRLVSADQAPAISDSAVHAAVCLVADETTPANDGLYAYAQIDGTNGWTKLDTTDFGTNLVTGSMVALRVLIDYGEQEVTYEGAFLANAETDTPVYSLLGTTDMANPDSTVTSLSSISFKGTGGVDDLFVSKIHEEASTATISAMVYDEADLTVGTSLGTKSIDTVAAGSNYTSAVDVDTVFADMVVKSITLYDTTGGSEVLCTPWTAPTVNLSTGSFTVTMDNYAFQVGRTYLIKIVMGEPSSEPTYTGPKANGVQILVAADEADYEAAEQGNEYVPLSFTSFSVNGNSVTAGLAGTFLTDDANHTSATFVVVTQTTLGGAEDRQNVTGTLTVTGVHTATLTFNLPQSDSLFVKGLYVADPAPSND